MAEAVLAGGPPVVAGHREWPAVRRVVGLHAACDELDAVEGVVVGDGRGAVAVLGVSVVQAYAGPGLAVLVVEDARAEAVAVLGAVLRCAAVSLCVGLA